MCTSHVIRFYACHMSGYTHTHARKETATGRTKYAHAHGKRLQKGGQVDERW